MSRGRKLGRLLLAGIAFGVLAAVGLAFICEPLIVLLLGRAGIWGDGGLLLEHPWMWIAEVLIGFGGIAFAVAKAQARSRSRVRSS